MRQALGVAVGALMCFVSVGLAAASPFDQFDYPDGTILFGAGSINGGWDGPWTGTSAWEAKTPGLSYGTMTYSLSVAGNQALVSLNPFFGSSIQRSWSSPTFGASGDHLYMSFIAEASNDDDDALEGVQLGGTSSSDYLFIGKSVGESEWGITDGTLSAVSTRHANEHVFVLVRIDFNSTWDDVYVWINPTIDQEPSTGFADISYPQFHHYADMTHVRLTAAAGLQSLAFHVDELRIGQAWAEVVPRVENDATCSKQGKQLTLTATNGSLSSNGLAESWRDVAVAKSRTCVDHPPKLKGDWVPVDLTSSPVAHDLSASAPDSWAFAESQVNILTNSPTELVAETFVQTAGNAQTTGCSSKWRKHRSHVRQRAVSKIKGTGKFANANGLLRGLFRNCKAKPGRAHKNMSDPVVITARDIPSGNVTRYPVIDIQSRVFDGETSWLFSRDSSGFFLNTAKRMLLSIDVTSPVIQASQQGTIAVECRGGLITSATTSGVFSALSLPSGPLVVGKTSSFTFGLPHIAFGLQVPGDPLNTEFGFESGGGTQGEELGPAAIEEGCNLVTGVGDGVDDVDTSSPQGADATIGFPADLGQHLIAQEFIVPGPLPTAASSVRLLAYQAGMPTTVPPSIVSATAQVWDGPPWLSQSHPIYGQVSVPASQLETDWIDADRIPTAHASDDGSRPIMEIWLWGETDNDVILQPGPKWLVFGVSGDPAYGPLEMPPCPFAADPISLDNSYGYDAATGQWSQLFDAGSGRPVSFPVDVFADSAGVVSVDLGRGDNLAMASLGQNAPNPATHTTHIEFSIPRSAPTRVVIFDLAGRRVRTLLDATLGPGAHRLEWDGRDTAGRRVPSGMYSYRLETGGTTLVKHMMFLE